MGQSSSSVPACLLIIFGASGDLTKRLLLPALYNLAASKMLPDGFRLLGVAQQDWNDQEFQGHIEKSLSEFRGADAARDVAEWLKKRASYKSGDFADAGLFKSLRDTIGKLGAGGDAGGNCLFYLAVSPSFISSIAQQLSQVELLKESDGHWARLVIEKPFGHDLASAQALSADLRKCLREEQIYRIDHFAGKNSVRDLTVFRFSNTVFETFWNRSSIANVQITAAETVGLEGRGEYYEKSGALRDMVPNHLAEMLSLVAMESPVSFDAAHMRAKQADVLESILPISPGEVSKYAVRGQYGAGAIDGKQVPAYRSEEGVNPASIVETFAAMQVCVDNWRWAGVPFYLRTGKHLTRSTTEIVITFKQTPARLFPNSSNQSASNQLWFRLQPDPVIELRFGSQASSLKSVVEESKLQFQLPQGPFSRHETGYERLLHDVMIGDGTLFQGAAFIQAGWRMVQPVLDAWSEPPKEFFPDYAAGSAGPKAADDLVIRSGHRWHSLEER